MCGKTRFHRMGLFIFVLWLGSCGLFAQKTLVHAGYLIDVTAGKVLTKVSIHIDGTKIVAVENGFSQAASDQTVIDLSAYTVMPGLIDMHTHLSFEISPTSYNEGFRMEPADFAFRMTVFAERTLMAGFTTVRDLGDSKKLTASLRNAIANGFVDGPRIFTAGKSLATTGGHADPTNGLVSEFMGDPGPHEGVLNSPEEARKAVRQRYKEGSDLIKVTATGGVLSQAKNGQNPQFTESELEAVVATARDYGFKVAAHAHGIEGMKRAIRAGVSSIEHGTFLDEEGMALMKAKGTYLVPTLMAGEHVTKLAEIDGYLPEVVRPKARAIGPLMATTLGKAYNEGLKIAFGTDSGVSPHGENAREFELLVLAGVPQLAAIQMATVHAADLLGQSDILGSVTPGKYADLVAVKGDPLKNIGLLRNIPFVMKEGKVYKNIP